MPMSAHEDTNDISLDVPALGYQVCDHHLPNLTALAPDTYRPGAACRRAAPPGLQDCCPTEVQP